MKGSKILVVEDTPDLLDLYSIYLQQEGYEVLGTGSGYECLDIVRKELPDLVLLDIMLPDISGIDVCREIKAQPDTAGILVIHVSGMLTSGENQAEGLEAGADGYLTKPFEGRTLLAHVKALLRIKKTEEKLRQSEEQFRAAFGNALDAILIADDQGTYVDANPAACAMFGVSREEILTRKVFDFVMPGHQVEIEKVWQMFLEQGEQKGEFRLYRPDGTTRELEFQAKASFLPHRHLSVLRDVTDRKKNEEALLEAHEELEKRVQQRTAELLGANAFLKQEIADREQAEKTLLTATREWEQTFNAIPDQLSILDKSGAILRANKSMRERFEPAHGNLIGLNYRLCYCGTTTPDLEPPCAAVLSGAPAVMVETQLPTIPGWHLVASYPLLDGDDKQWGAVSVVRDITVRKHAQEKLEESEERFRLLIAGVSDYAIYMLDTAGKVVSWNEGAKKIKGYEQEEILGKHFSCFYLPEDVEAGVPALELEGATREGRYENEGWHIRKNGSRFWANVLIIALRDENGSLRGFSKVTRDITERKLAVEALQQAEEKYRTIFENAMEGIFQSTPDGRFIAANPAMARIFGYDSPEELMLDRRDIGRQHYVEPDRRIAFKKLMAEEGSVHQFEIEAYRKDGTKIWTSENVRSVRNATGEVLYYEGIVHDVTEHKRLQETRQLLSSIVEFSSDAIISFSPGGNIMSWNAGAEKMFGYDKDEMRGRDISIFLPPETVRESIPLFRVVEGGQPIQFETVRLRKDGSHIDVSIISSPIKNEKGEVVGVSAIVRDISDRKRADEMRNQLLQKLVVTQEEERRRLSRELHDQMGQSLAALMLGLKSLGDSGDFNPPANERLQELQLLTNQVAQEVHTLARELRPTALDDLGLSTALANYVEEWSERSQVAADFHSNGLLKRRLPPHIETAVYRIVQEALTNVLKHAQSTNVSVIVEYRAGRVRTIVEDNGCGFDAETVMRGPAHERRLGLLGMQERVTLLGGSLKVESTPSAGTTVLANIPVEI